MKREIGELKKRAFLAKQRLRMGYWERLAQKKRELGENAGERDVVELQRAELARDELAAFDRERAQREERLYERVCEILDDENECAPIGRLIDQKVYKTLDEGGKQRYVLELARKFRELSERYYLERRTQTAR